MNFRTCILIAGLIPSSAAYGDVLVLEPSAAAVLPSDESGIASVVFRFDLSGMREGSSREIVSGLIDWIVPGVPGQSDSEFEVYQVTGSWSEAGAAESRSAVARDEDVLCNWRIEGLDYGRSGGAVRFDITALVEGWADETISNFGIVIESPDVTESDFTSGLTSARLTIRYGFRAPED
jgi:hypothetical protein